MNHPADFATFHDPRQCSDLPQRDIAVIRPVITMRSAIRDVISCGSPAPRVIDLCVIRSFACKETEKLFYGSITRHFPADLGRRARTKLLLLHAAIDLNDLKCPPGNRLEALTGDRKGQFSIRINQQYRLCFRWLDQGADQVEILDYH
jgi:proteic killer suppression protein